LLFLSFNLLMASNTFDINLVVFNNYIPHIDHAPSKEG